MSRLVGVLIVGPLVACAPNPPAPSVTAPTTAASVAASASTVAPAPGTTAPPPEASPRVADTSCDTSPADLHVDRPLSTKPAPAGGASLMAPTFSGGYDFYEIDAAPAPRTVADVPLQLTLRAPSASLTTRDPVGFELTFADTGTGRVTVLHPLDGTLEHMREPSYDLFLRDEGTSKVYRYAFVGGRCGNVNAIAREDYVDLKPATSRSDLDTSGWAPYVKDAVIGKPGTYTAWIVYRYCGGGPNGVPLGQDIVRKETLVGVHASNAVTLTVR